MTSYAVKAAEGTYTVDLSVTASSPTFAASGGALHIESALKVTFEPTASLLKGRKIGLVQLIAPMSTNAPGFSQRAYEGWAVDKDVPTPAYSNAAAAATPTSTNAAKAAAEQRIAEAERTGIRSALIYGCDRLGKPKVRPRGSPYPEVEYSMTFAEDKQSKVAILTDRPNHNVPPKNPPARQLTVIVDYPFDLVKSEFVGFGVRFGFALDGTGQLSVVTPTAGEEFPKQHLEAIKTYIKLAGASGLTVTYPPKKKKK
jgi:hypothetical protein